MAEQYENQQDPEQQPQIETREDALRALHAAAAGALDELHETLDEDDADTATVVVHVYRDSIRVLTEALAAVAAGVPPNTREGRLAKRVSATLEKAARAKDHLLARAEQHVVLGYLRTTADAVNAGTDIDPHADPLWHAFAVAMDGYDEGTDDISSLFTEYLAAVRRRYPEEVTGKVMAHADALRAAWPEDEEVTK